MAITQIRGAQIKDREISSAKIQLAAIIEELLATNSVSTSKIVDHNVTTIKLADGAVTADKLAADSVVTVKILDANVTTPKLADKAVTAAKIGDAAITGGAQLASTVDANGKTFSGDVTFSGNIVVPTPDLTTEAANKGYVDTAIQSVNNSITALGNAFNYVGALSGGAQGSAYDLATLAADGKNAGDYYKVDVAGYFKIGAGAEFYANVGDGLVWNIAGSVDKIDNTDSNVQGTVDYITVTGSADTGFIVDVATTLKTRISTLETEASAAQTAIGLNNDGTLTAFSGTSYLDAQASLKAALIALDTQVKANADHIGNVANLTTSSKANLVSALNEINAKSVGDTYVRETPVGSIDGTNTIFTLSNSPIASTVQVFLNGVLQETTDDYTLSGTAVTFASAPFSGDKVKVIYFKA